MSGSIQTPSELMTIELADNNGGGIRAANARNVVESLTGVASQAKTASYTVALTDRGTTLNISSTSATNVTVNINVLSAGHQFAIRQTNTGQVTVVAGSGMSRQSGTGTFSTRAQWSLILVTVHTDGTTLLLDGDLA